ncbi:MAG: LysE family translocator [Pseudomonadota bacterium]
MDLASLAIFALALALATGSPGPSIAALVARVIARGWRDVAPFLAAMWIGEILWLTLAVSGLSALAESFHLAFMVLKYLGILYLLYLAWQMWHAATDAAPEDMPEKATALGKFAAGMALTLGNPKIMVFYLALLPSLVDLTAVDLSIWAILAAVTFVTIMVVDLTWVAMAHHARRFLRTPRAIRASNRVGATTLGGAAVLIATR